MNSLTRNSNHGTTQLQFRGTAEWCRSLLFKSLTRMDFGCLVVQEGDNRYHFGREKQPCANLTIRDRAAYGKILFGGSIGAAEAYVDKLWDVDDLTALIRIMVRNMSLLDSLDKGFAWLLKPVDLVKHFLNANSRRGAKRNILAHYDLGNDMYRAFLGSSMMYSSAIYPTPETTLEEAQEHKLEVLCQKLDLQPGDSVLEIGTGWGGFALYAAGKYGCHVTTTTISESQYEEAAKRIAAAGLTDKITLLKSDYRDLTGQFDKLVSVEMIEAVGHKFLPAFFKKCGELLKPDGKMVIQAITITDQKYKQYIRGVDFIQRYVFPGGCLPSINMMVQSIAARTDMVVRQIDDFGLNYARTLQDWLKRFRESYPKLQNQGYDETFKRLWEFYLCYCQGGFIERSISVVHLVATRPHHRERNQ